MLDKIRRNLKSVRRDIAIIKIELLIFLLAVAFLAGFLVRGCLE